MDLQLRHKVILVAGGGGRTGSIGATMVESLALEGAIPVVMDFAPTIHEQVSQLQSRGLQAMACQVDLTEPAAVAAAVNEVLARYGRINGVVNNAGVNDGVDFSSSIDAFEASLRKNMVYMFTVVKYALPALKAAKGSIVNVGSKVALTGQGHTSGYAAAKGAVLGLTREWALELAPEGIRVNALMIAECWTPAYEDWISTLPDPEATLDRIRRRIPLGHRMTRPEEIADLTLFILSERAAHITGQFLHIDGGYVHLDRAMGDLRE